MLIITSIQLAHLLDLKQKHANAFEARFARDQATFTGRQGQTIMVFTIVTVIFLPMSFIAALFAVPITEFPHQDGSLSLPLPYVSKFVFGVGLAISIPLIVIAFSVDDIFYIFRRGSRGLWFPHRRRADPLEATTSPPRNTRPTTIPLDSQLENYWEERRGSKLSGSRFSRRSGDTAANINSNKRTSRDRRAGSDDDAAGDGIHLSSPVTSSRPRRSSVAYRDSTHYAIGWKEEAPWNGRTRGSSRDLERGPGAR